MKSLLALLSAGVLLTAAFSACSSGAAEEAGTDDNPLRTITLTPTQLGLMPGEERQLVATVSDGAPVKWNSSDWDAVSVSAEGVVKALAYGIATVTAASGHATASCDITVPMASVTPSSVQLKVGESMQFETEYIPADLQFEWSTSDEKVITVKNGIVTAVAEGSAMVIAKAAGLQANAKVIVSKQTAMVATKDMKELTEGDELRVEDKSYEIASLTTDDFDRKIGIAEVDLPDGVYEGTVIVQKTHPIEFLTKSDT